MNRRNFFARAAAGLAVAVVAPTALAKTLIESEPKIVVCNGCGKSLLKDNEWMEDGCPCNSPRGINTPSDPAYAGHCVSIDISVDISREEIFELGQRGPYHRFVDFPVEVTEEVCMVGNTKVWGDSDYQTFETSDYSNENSDVEIVVGLDSANRLVDADGNIVTEFKE